MYRTFKTYCRHNLEESIYDQDSTSALHSGPHRQAPQWFIVTSSVTFRRYNLVLGPDVQVA